jgi:hypothetical protein
MMLVRCKDCEIVKAKRKMRDGLRVRKKKASTILLLCKKNRLKKKKKKKHLHGCPTLRLPLEEEEIP